MPKPRTLLVRNICAEPPRHVVIVGRPSLKAGPWRPADDKPAEQVHLLIYTGVFSWPFLVPFHNPASLDALIADLSACRREVWPDPLLTVTEGANQ